MNYKVVFTRLFRKQLKRIKKRGRSNQKIRNTILCLSRGQDLSERFRVHKLKGLFKGMYELHIEPDLLLIYEYKHDILVLKLIKIGSHSDLFI